MSPVVSVQLTGFRQLSEDGLADNIVVLEVTSSNLFRQPQIPLHNPAV